MGTRHALIVLFMATNLKLRARPECPPDKEVRREGAETEAEWHWAVVRKTITFRVWKFCKHFARNGAGAKFVTYAHAPLRETCYGDKAARDPGGRAKASDIVR